MTCNDVQERLSAFIDGELSDKDSAEAFAHAGTCRDCRDLVGSLVRVRSVLSRLPVVQPDARLDDRIVHAEIHRLWRGSLRVPAAALAAGVALFLLTATLSLWLWLSPLARPAQEVVYVFGLPQVEVYGTTTGNGENQR